MESEELSQCVWYHGELDPSEVIPVFREHDCLALPTRGENFGHVIAESLSASCPVIASSATPFTGTLNAGGGAIVSPLSVEALKREIESWAALPPGQRVDAKRRAGVAYESWRREQPNENLLNVLAVTEGS